MNKNQEYETEREYKQRLISDLVNSFAERRAYEEFEAYNASLDALVESEAYSEMQETERDLAFPG